MVISLITFYNRRKRKGNTSINTKNNTNSNSNHYSPIKPKYRSARIRFDLNEQLWFVETPVYKKKKKVDSDSNNNNADSNSISNTSTNRVGRSLTINKNNNSKDRSRSSSLTSIRSNNNNSNKKITNKNTRKSKAIDKKFNPDNLPDIDRIQSVNGMDNLPENPKTKKESEKKKNHQPPSKSKVPSSTSSHMNRLNALTFPKILAIHQSTTPNDKHIKG